MHHLTKQMVLEKRKEKKRKEKKEERKEGGLRSN